MSVELLVENNGNFFLPTVHEGVVWETERKNSPGKLTFTIIRDKDSAFEEGNAVSFKVNGEKVFYGFVFTKKNGKDMLIKTTAYDQLRYLKNKDTYVYMNKTASEVIQMIADDFRLNLGEIEDTRFKIASRVEDNTSLFDMIGNALDITLLNTKTMYVLYDDFGKFALKSLGNMKLDLVIDAETGEDFDYYSTIDEQTYNKVKLLRENEETGERDVYIAQSSENINKWGVLQYFDTLSKDENGESKVNSLLGLYNTKTKSLKISNALGDIRVRAGSLVIVNLDLGDTVLQNYMMVEKCRHTFKESVHFMDFTLRGGEFIG